MSAFIETLNRWGENFLGFAWPMLWQSSLLIVVVFALDYVLARKIRAAVRHALWMVVLVKLLLPPALALPTGATWWLWRPKPAPIVPIVKNYTVNFDQTPMSDSFAPPTVPIILPPPRLSNAGWVLLASGAMSAGLFLWLLLRWRRVARNVRRISASSDFVPVLEEARQLAGLHSRIRLKLIEDKQSPAVYGLVRPVILLPGELAKKLSPKQLRAVLLHEAIHLRRGDVWTNCAQTLLQIAYWRHPLLWLANARIRRVREEAVDDAVMLALRKDADAYAPTLLEVARFAFRRPLASLGLIGILESRSALRQRVERLMDFRPPRKAGLTFLSLCGIFAFSAVALPMGQGPTPTNALSSDAPIIQTGQTYGDVFSKQTESGLSQALAMERKQAHMDLLWHAKANPSQTPYTPGRNLNRTVLGYYHLDQFGSFQQAPLSAVIDTLSLKIPVPILALSELLNGSQTLIDLPKMTNVALPEVLDAIIKGANRPIQYLMIGNEIVFSPVPRPPNFNDELFDPVSGTKIFEAPPSTSVNTHDLEQQTFAVDYGRFIARMHEETGETNAISPDIS